MFIRVLLRWLLYALVLGSLSACGGGGDEPSNLLDDKGTDDGGDTGGDTTDPTTIGVAVAGETIVIAGDNTATITLTSLDGTTTTNPAVVASVPMRLTVTGSARFSDGSTTTLDVTTNSQGQTTFNVVDNTAETVTVSIAGRENYEGSFSFQIYFGASVVASVSPIYPTVISAGGSDSATLTVQARNAAGVPIAGQDVQLSFAQGSFATAAEASGSTNAQGQFTTTITNTIAQDTSVTPIVGGYTVKPALSMRFGASAVYTNPSSIRLLVSANNVPANGTDAARVLVVAQDDAGVPVPNVPVTVAIDSGTAQLSVNNSNYQPIYINGNTGSSGNFTVYIKNTVEETINLTASARITTSDQTTEVISGDIQVTFKNPTTTTGAQIASVVLDSPVSTPSPATANGTDTINIIGRVLDDAGKPVASTAVSFLTSNGLSIPNATTDSAGFFRISLTSTTVESYTLRAVVAGISSSTVTITFNSRTSSNPDTAPTPPSSVTLIASPSTLIADGTAQTTLTAIVRDSANTPMSGIQVSIAASGSNASTALFDEGVLETGSSGTAVFKLSNTIAGSTTITVTAVALTSAGVPSGATVTDSEIVIFTNPATQVAQLDVSCTPVGTSTGTTVTCGTGLKANGTDQATINVIARDSTGKPVENAPIIILGTGGASVANPASGKTNSNGYFSSSVTSTDVGPADFTVTVDGVSTGGSSSLAKNVRINFEATSGSAPATIDVEALNSPQPADGASKITIVVTPRDSTNTPITGTSVEVFVDSLNTTLTSASGTTNSLGEFRTTVTSTVAESNIAVVAVAGGVRSDAIGTPITITFTSGTTLPPEQTPDSLVLTVSQPSADTGSNINITVLARKNNVPLGDVPLVLTATGNVAGSTVFDNFSGKTATNTGAFTTTVTSSQAGTVTIQARLNAENVTLTSNSVELTFKPASGSTADVASLELLTASPTLGSEGNPDGVVITAIVKDSNNNLVSDVTVNFSSVCGIPSDLLSIVPAGFTQQNCESINTTTGQANTGAAGELQAIAISGDTSSDPGITNSSGRAQARLTTQSNVDNRYITVVATINRADGTSLKKAVPVQVVGTTLNITGESALITGSTSTYSVSVRNSAGTALSGQVLSVSSTLGNTLSFTTTQGTVRTGTTIEVITNSNGRADISLAAGLAGAEILTVTKPGASGITTVTKTIQISGDIIQIVPVTGTNTLCTSLDSCVIPLNTNQQFSVVWNRQGVPTAGEVTVNTSRGAVSPATLTVDGTSTCKTTPFISNCFTLSANNVGSAIVKVTGVSSTTSLEFTVNFRAVTADRIDLQTNNSVLAANTSGNETSQAELTATVRDTNDNLVEGAVVNFVLADVTGGRLTKSSAVTDAFGKATVTYIAGSSQSAQNGVVVTANLISPDTTPNATNIQRTDTVNLTISQGALFVSLGTGNVMTKSTDGLRYIVPFTALVTDANGAPVNGASVTISIYPKQYSGQKLEVISGTTFITATYTCNNEDVNRNGLLDSAEDSRFIGSSSDITKNGRLDPGGVITVDKATAISGPTSTSDDTPSGYVDFNVIYPIQYATYLSGIELTARATVSGSEGSATIIISAPCLKDDADNDICPVQPPFLYISNPAPSIDAVNAAIAANNSAFFVNNSVGSNCVADDTPVTGVTLADNNIPERLQLVITPPATTSVNQTTPINQGTLDAINLARVDVIAQKRDTTTGQFVGLSGIPIRFTLESVTPDNIMNSVTFSSATGTTLTNGSFSTEIQSVCPGTVKVVAYVNANNSQLGSNATTLYDKDTNPNPTPIPVEVIFSLDSLGDNPATPTVETQFAYPKPLGCP
ncbi:Ig-like domain-containing protein [Beggiatoa alba B18LD]|uniref:Ig-like domain-containing protein n=1 Tax=Beggiatoa alba B18LD TaxID=395493 RepID=I3CH37_9GAMM|nr:Ig-like domain-containing protein [Beggiatoa alba]EIJ42930.1 Ig-like domain-containing protein [Beggiatoa alba B18LD]